MGIGTNPDYTRLDADAFAATLDWWREAGVDAAFQDEPRSWLPPPEEQAKPAAPGASRLRPAPDPAPQAALEPEPMVLPDSLEAFHSWWMEAAELDGGRITGRVAPRGEPSPELMVIACTPEESDSEHLMSGPEGRLIDAFVTASGLQGQAIYLASALPCHSPGTNWSPQANRLAAEALLRHVMLVRPKRLLVIGFVILPLLGHDSPQGPAVSSSFNHEETTIPMLAVRRIPAAASQPRWKAALWQAWLDWTAPVA